MPSYRPFLGPLSGLRAPHLVLKGFLPKAREPQCLRVSAIVSCAQRYIRNCSVSKGRNRLRKSRKGFPRVSYVIPSILQEKGPAFLWPGFLSSFMGRTRIQTSTIRWTCDCPFKPSVATILPQTTQILLLLGSDLDRLRRLANIVKFQ